jgi:hypothetical protein
MASDYWAPLARTVLAESGVLRGRAHHLPERRPCQTPYNIGI